MYSYASCGIELYEEEINDKTKTFVIRYNYDIYANGDDIATETSYHVAYGYYSIETVYERDDYIEYHLKLDYVEKDDIIKNETLVVTVKPDTTYCYSVTGKLLKQN